MPETVAPSRSRLHLPSWAWILLAAAVVAVVFLGYGQVDLLLDAVNLRYCG